MSRITTPVLARSIQQVRGMTLAQKEQLMDDMFRSQPTLLSACIVQHKMGIPFEKMLFASVMSELLPWLDQCGLAEDHERYVMLAAITAVNCIANLPMPSVKKTKK